MSNEQRGAILCNPGTNTAGTSPTVTVEQVIDMSFVEAALKEFEKKQAEKKPRITTRKRLDQAGLFTTSPKMFWIASAGLGVVGIVFCGIGFFAPLAVHLF